MRLSLHTDFSLRVLMYLAALEPGQLATTPVLAEQFKVSPHHLQKVVQTLRRIKVIETTQGNGGGSRLRVAPTEIRLGTLLRQLENQGELVDCGRGPCPLMQGCVLKSMLDDAENVFFDRLDQYNLADTIVPPVKDKLHVLRLIGTATRASLLG